MLRLISKNFINFKFCFKMLNKHNKYQFNQYMTQRLSSSNKDPNLEETTEDTKIQINYNNIKGVKNGDSNHYIIQFTCKKCDHRTTRMFTKRSYHHGIVLIKCEGCEGIHLIADNLGWFEDTSVNIEMIIERNGEKYKKLSAEGLFQLSTEDIAKH